MVAFKNNKTAFVLGGGSIKGIWQVGAINSVMDRYQYPDIITGISVGNLNANLIANFVGKHFTENPSKSLNWGIVSDELRKFWFDNIKAPEDIAKKKSIFKIGYELLRGKFNSFNDTTPLRKLIKENIQPRYIERSGLKISSGCTNLKSGKIFYTDKSTQNYKQFVQSSAAIPFMMPVEVINNIPYVDGGLIDSAPIKQAIELGATKLIVFANHPVEVGFKDINVNNPMQYADRIMEIIVNNTLNNDISEAMLINELLSKKVKCKKTENKKILDITIIRPKTKIDLKIDNFDSKDLKKLWEDGYVTANTISL